MILFVMIWIVMGVVTLGLALYRKGLAMREDPYVHLADGEQREIPQQVATFTKIGKVDQAGITLTILTAVFGLVLAGVYVYQAVVHPR